MVRHGAASAQRGGVTSWAEGEISVVPAEAGTSQPCGGRFPSFLRRQEPRSPAVGGFRRSCEGRNLAALGLGGRGPIITPSQYPHTQPLHRALARLDSILRRNDGGRGEVPASAGTTGGRGEVPASAGTTAAGGEVPASAGTTGAGGEVPAYAGTTGAGNGVPASAGTTGATTGRCPHRGPATRCSLRRSNGPSTHASIS